MFFINNKQLFSYMAVWSEQDCCEEFICEECLLLLDDPQIRVRKEAMLNIKSIA